MKNYIISLLLLSLFALATSCSEDENSVEPIAIETLDDYSLFFERSKNELESLINGAGLSDVTGYLDHDIVIYKITYKTEFKGKEIIASGLVTFPNTESAVPMMSFQHGTMIAHEDAPTEDTQTYALLSGVASAGYIFLIPDFIGFGSSSDVLHPYYEKDYTASSIIDMLQAARELAALEGYNFNGNVFLSGYSEGGFATMAAHKEMEENPVEGLNLVASAPSSGGYDVKGMQEYFFEQETYDQPFYMAYVALAYKTTYDWEEPLSDFFQEPYATKIPGYFDGTKDGGQINALLTDVIADYVSSDFLSGVDTDTKYTKILGAFEYNSLDDWVPTKRMFMYHGNADITVPYQNSVDTYEHMVLIGANPSVVTFTTLEGATHGTGFFPYLVDVIEQFDALK